MQADALLQELNRHIPLINPSLLAARFAHLEDEIRQLETAGAKVIHIDVMDGHFVPNISYGIPIVQAVRRITDLPLDVHLMITNPKEHIEAFRTAGADILTVHAELWDDARPILQRIRDLGALAGIALNPPTPIGRIEPYVDACDLILPMSVMPGFGGQAFDPAALDKLRWLKEHARPDALLEVDGGVNTETIADCAAAGATLFVTGTALLEAPDIGTRFRELREAAITG